LGNLTELILVAPILLFSMVAHEYAHGYIAYLNGDPTAYQLGRLTWNPLKHIDPFMTIILPTILALSHAPILGGAKPVPVNPRNYRNFKRGDITVSLAGITMNVILAFVCTLVVPLLYWIAQLAPNMARGLALVQEMFIYGITINLLLAAFNLIPIPPLDGSHVFKYILPPAWALSYERVGRYGLFLLYALLFFGGTLLFTWFQPVFWMSSWLVKLVLRFVLPLPFSLSM
jgi:Zn-dependent protease